MGNDQSVQEIPLPPLPLGALKKNQWKKGHIERMIRRKKLSPCWEEKEERSMETEDCAICLSLFEGGLNHCRKCDRSICTVCYLQIKSPKTKKKKDKSKCPYCKVAPFETVFRGTMTDEERLKQIKEEQQVMKLQIQKKERLKKEALEREDMIKKQREAQTPETPIQSPLMDLMRQESSIEQPPYEEPARTPQRRRRRPNSERSQRRLQRDLEEHLEEHGLGENMDELLLQYALRLSLQPENQQNSEPTAPQVNIIQNNIYVSVQQHQAERPEAIESSNQLENVSVDDSPSQDLNSSAQNPPVQSPLVQNSSPQQEPSPQRSPETAQTFVDIPEEFFMEEEIEDVGGIPAHLKGLEAELERLQRMREKHGRTTRH